jgi:hypothetical protein
LDYDDVLTTDNVVKTLQKQYFYDRLNKNV